MEKIQMAELASDKYKHPRHPNTEGNIAQPGSGHGTACIDCIFKDYTSSYCQQEAIKWLYF